MIRGTQYCVRREGAQQNGFTTIYSNKVTCWFQLHEMSHSQIIFLQGCTIVGCQVTVVTKFCMVVPDVCGSSVWNLLHVILLAPGNLRWLLDFWKIFALLYTYIHTYIHTCTYACRYTTHMTACHGQVFNPIVSYSIWQLWCFSLDVEKSCLNWYYSSGTTGCTDKC